MPHPHTALIVLVALIPLAAGCPAPVLRVPVRQMKNENLMEKPISIDSEALVKALVDKHGETQRGRIQRGLNQVLALWRTGDGDAEALRTFVMDHFISDEETLRDTARRLESSLEMLFGHANEVSRELSRYQVLDEGPTRPVDGLLAAYSPTAHILEDLFQSRVAFVALLNWPQTSLEQRLGEGKGWTREQWALARLTGTFQHRLPPTLLQEAARVSAAVEAYIDNYNIRLDRLVMPEGTAPFPTGLKLISHWGLRDEIRGQYARPDGLPRQQLIATVMERIIRQEVPRAVIDDASLEWDPVKNLVRTSGGAWRETEREPDTRYEHLLRYFRVSRKADPYFPGLATYIDRIFDIAREVPEARMRELLENVLSSPVAREVGALIRSRLGRDLQPFDLWYPGFQPRSKLDEGQLDALVRGRYPTVERFQADLPNILGKLGFDVKTAAFLADHIVVDPARGAGHAMGAKRRDDKAHLRTRFSKGGMDYKGFNIAIHELGHNVEQVFSMSMIDHTLLEGVPNTGFTEAFAFLFQAHDLELLGQAEKDPQAEALRTLESFWHAFEIAGVALLDMDIWHFMYKHPEASPAEVRQAMVELARNLWNRFYAPVFGVRDVILPAIYSHIIAYGLYTPDYPLGFLITFQVEQYIRKGRSLAVEMERMCRLGRLAPDIWMEQAVGAPVSSQPLLTATAEALKIFQK